MIGGERIADIDLLQIRVTADESNAESGLNRLLNIFDRIEKRLERLNAVSNALDSALGNTAGEQRAENALSRVNAALERTTTGTGRATSGTQYYSQTVQNLVNILSQYNQTNINVSNSVNQTVNQTVRATTQINNYTRTARKAAERTNNFGASQKNLFKDITSTVARVYILYMALNSLAQRFAAMYKASNDYIENLNLFRVTMRDNTDAALAFADSVEKIMGINLSEWLNYQGKFKQLSAGFGVVNEQADVMSKNLTQLSYDLSSFFNVSAEKAFDKLSSAMAGQVKGLREFGIDTSIASLQEYALSKNIELSVRKMTQAQKAVLRYNYILERSVNIHGDLARTIETPSNALRILTAQMEQFRRAVGNIVSVVVTKFLPYVQAGVMLLTEWADSLAKEWGFELPKIDYSNLDYAVSITDEVDDNLSEATDNIDAATKAAKKFKLQLMGFDELNILKSPTDDTDSLKNKLDDIASAYPSDLGLGVPEYDFGLDRVSNKAKDIADKLRKFFDIPDLLTLIQRIQTLYNWIHDKLPKPLQTIMDLMTVVFGAKLILGFIRKVKELWGLLKVSAVGRFFSGFITGWKNAEDGTSRFKSGLKNARDSLTTFEKVATVAFSTIFAALTSRDFFYKFRKGALDSQSAVTDLIGVTASLAMAFATGGWVGLAIAGLGAVAGAIQGTVQAIEENITDKVRSAFYDNIGTPITDIATSMSNLMGSISETYDTYNEKFNKIAESKTSIEATVSNIDSITSAFVNGGISAEDAAKKISGAIESLPDSIKSHAQTLYDSIYYSLSSPFGDAVEAAGLSKAKLLELAGDTVGSISTKADLINDKLAKLKDDLDNGRISSESYVAESAKYTAELQALINKPTNEAADAITNFQKSIDDLDLSNINWESEEERSTAFSKISEAAQNAKGKVDEFYNNLSETLTTFRDKQEKGSEAYNFFQNAIDVSENTRQSELSKITSAVEDFSGKVRESVLKTMTDKLSDIDKDTSWGEKAWFQTWSGKSYSDKLIEDFKNNVLNPLDADMDKALKSAGSKTKSGISEWLQQGINDITKGNDRNFNWDELSSYFSKHSEDIATGSAKDYAEKFKKNYVEKMTEPLPDKIKESFQSGYQGIGTLSAQKFSENFNSNVSIKPVTVPVNYQTNLPAPKGVSTIGNFQISQYASGGFPTMGDMFIARERGPELVGQINGKTAVANNDQIVTAISQAVYNAFMAAQGGNSPIDLHLTVEMDGDVVGEKAITYHNNLVMSEGVSPLKI